MVVHSVAWLTYGLMGRNLQFMKIVSSSSSNFSFLSSDLCDRPRVAKSLSNTTKTTRSSKSGENEAGLRGYAVSVRRQLRLALGKAHVFIERTSALLSEKKVTQVGCQLWSGLFCYATGFIRPLFSVLQDIFLFFVSSTKRARPPAECQSRSATKSW